MTQHKLTNLVAVAQSAMKENVSPKELKAIRLIATNLLTYNEKALQAAIKAGELKEVTYV